MEEPEELALAWWSLHTDWIRDSHLNKSLNMFDIYIYRPKYMCILI